MSAKAKTPKIPQNPLKREPRIVSLSRLSRMSEKLSIFFWIRIGKQIQLTTLDEWSESCQMRDVHMWRMSKNRRPTKS